MTRLLNLLNEAEKNGKMEERQPYDKLLQAAEYGATRFEKFQCFHVITHLWKAPWDGDQLQSCCHSTGPQTLLFANISVLVTQIENIARGTTDPGIAVIT